MNRAVYEWLQCFENAEIENEIAGNDRVIAEMARQNYLLRKVINQGKFTETKEEEHPGLEALIDAGNESEDETKEVIEGS